MLEEDEHLSQNLGTNVELLWKNPVADGMVVEKSSAEILSLRDGVLIDIPSDLAYSLEKRCHL